MQTKVVKLLEINQASQRSRAFDVTVASLLFGSSSAISKTHKDYKVDGFLIAISPKRPRTNVCSIWFEKKKVL